MIPLIVLIIVLQTIDHDLMYMVKVFMDTNCIDILDQALLRPGKIDRKIKFPNPNEDIWTNHQVCSARASICRLFHFLMKKRRRPLKRKCLLRIFLLRPKAAPKAKVVANRKAFAKPNQLRRLRLSPRRPATKPKEAKAKPKTTTNRYKPLL